MTRFHGNLVGIASMACAFSVSAHATAPVASGVEGKLLDIIEAHSLQEVDETACLKAIQRELSGKRGKACFGPYDKVLAQEATAQKVVQLTDPVQTVWAKTPGSWTYIKIKYFGATTADEFYEAVKESGRARVILDLRHNGGGLVDQAFKITLLVADPHANQAVYTETTRNTEREGLALISRAYHTDELAERFYSDRPQRVGSFRDIRLAILIDEQSFSSSEILAEIMRRLNPGQVFLVGRQTYGKWCGQSWFPFTDTEGTERRLVLTTVQYAPGTMTTPPRHVEPDQYIDFSLDNLGDIGTPNDSPYMFAKRKLTGLIR